MGFEPIEVAERTVETDLSARELCGALRKTDPVTVLFDGHPDYDTRWGPRVAVSPTVCPEYRFLRGEVQNGLADLSRRIDRRRRAGGTADTGVAVLLTYEAMNSGESRVHDPYCPDVVVWEVDRAVRFDAQRVARITVRERADHSTVADIVTRLSDTVLATNDTACEASVTGTVETVVRSSLPRQAYLEAVEVVLHHIRRGDIYQANLTQTYTCPHLEDPFVTYRRLAEATPAPRAAFVDDGRFAVASVSPETFLDCTPEGLVETRPIKGTRPRGATPAEDRRAASELSMSEKDLAELVMIVDLERNDLGRVCRAGTIRVTELAGLRTYPAVHHLVARVEGELRDDVTPGELVAATFPGGSITGAPKRRAMEILRSLEPVQRGYYTGSLMWFGDDGTLDSSILIRSVVMHGGRAWLGAGGGVVADSVPELEWRESNDKARALAEVLGFRPEDAG